MDYHQWMLRTVFLALALFCLRCESSNKPKLTSTSHKVFKVKEDEGSQFDASDRYLTAQSGNTVVLLCQVEEGHKVSWNFSAKERRINIQDNKLLIINSKFADTGEYSCRFEFVIRTDWSNCGAGLLVGT